MLRRLNRCWRIFSWALDIVSEIQYAQCTDAWRDSVGSTGASHDLHLIFRGAQTCIQHQGVGSSDNHRMHRCYRHWFNRCYRFLQNSSISAFLWALSSCFALHGLFTSSLISRNVLLTKSLVPLIVWSFDHQNHLKWHKWCHVRYREVRKEKKREADGSLIQEPTSTGAPKQTDLI